MQPWDTWRLQWARHARTASFARRVDQARHLLDATPGGLAGLFLGLSGGKDSAACAGLLHEHGARVPWAYMHTALNLPDTPDTVAAIGDRFGVEVDVAEPDDVATHIRDACRMFKTPLPPGPASTWTEWDLLRVMPASADVLGTQPDDGAKRLAAAGARARILRVVASGNMLVAHAYATDARGSIAGLRADESRGRRMRAFTHGAHHVFQADGQLMVCPIQWWSGEDVLAFIESRGIPLHPYYRAAYEFFRGQAPPHELRVDLSLVPEAAARHGALAAIAKIYPDLFERLAAIRPEVRQYR